MLAYFLGWLKMMGKGKLAVQTMPVLQSNPHNLLRFKAAKQSLATWKRDVVFSPFFQPYFLVEIH